MLSSQKLIDRWLLTYTHIFTYTHIQSQPYSQLAYPIIDYWFSAFYPLSFGVASFFLDMLSRSLATPPSMALMSTNETLLSHSRKHSYIYRERERERELVERAKRAHSLFMSIEISDIDIYVRVVRVWYTRFPRIYVYVYSGSSSENNHRYR